MPMSGLQKETVAPINEQDSSYDPFALPPLDFFPQNPNHQARYAGVRKEGTERESKHKKHKLTFSYLEEEDDQNEAKRTIEGNAEKIMAAFMAKASREEDVQNDADMTASQEEDVQSEAYATLTDDIEIRAAACVAALSRERHEETSNSQKGKDIHNTQDSDSDQMLIEKETAQITARTNRKPGGRPLGSKQKKRKIAIIDPTLDMSGVPFSQQYVSRLRRRNPMLAAAYSELEAAKKEKENTAKTVATEEQNVENIIAQLQQAQTKLDDAKLKLERDESAIQRAVEQMEEAELKSPSRWNANFAKLAAYKEKHGHIQLPSTAPEDKELHSLCLWTASQKSKYQQYRWGLQKTHKPYRLKALDKLGMQWDVKCNRWQIQLNYLKEYKETHGHCMVPTRTSKEYKFLGSWVGTQRTEWKKLKDGKRSVLTPERIQILNDVGFVWNIHDSRWQTMYEKLLNFRKEFGHCRVPDTYPADQSLSNWIIRQRAEHAVFSGVDNGGWNSKGNAAKRCFLTPERIKLLEDVEMEWT